MQVGYSQGGTIRVNKNAHDAEIFSMSGNRDGQPQSFIILFDQNKAVFINGYQNAKYIWDNYFKGSLSGVKKYTGMFKQSDSKIFIYLTRGLGFKGNKIDDVLYLTDNSGVEVLFYKVYQ